MEQYEKRILPAGIGIPLLYFLAQSDTTPFLSLSLSLSLAVTEVAARTVYPNCENDPNLLPAL